MSAAADLALYVEGFARYQAGDFHGAHDAWEDLWLRHRGEARPFYQGLIQVAAAFHHLGNGRWTGFTRLLAAGGERLRPFEPAFLGVDVATLLVDLARAEAHAHVLGPSRLTSFAPTMVPEIRFEPPSAETFRPHAGTHEPPARRPRAR